jgi:cell shape-determining protein MreD
MGIGLLRRRSWARAPAAAVLGGYALLGWSVAAMGWSMVLGGAVDASVGLSIGSTAVAAAVTGYAVALYRPLFRRAASISAPLVVPAVLSAGP